MGVTETKIREEIARGGLTRIDASEIVDEVLASPIHKAASRIGGDLRKWNKLADALLDLQSQTNDFASIPRVSGLSSHEFLHHYYALNRPIIIEDVASHWPAMKKWNIDFLRKHFGKEQVSYQKGRSSTDFRESFTDHSTTGPFTEYLNLIASGRSTNDYYLIAHDRLLERKNFHSLLNDIIFDERYLDGKNTQGRVFFFLGPMGSTTPMHRDLRNVYLAQIMGRKAITMIPSMQLHRVYNEVGYHSNVDFDDWSHDNHPLLTKAHIAQEIISPGELLFIPLGWWHHVKALDVSITITGTNFCFDNTFNPIF